MSEQERQSYTRGTGTPDMGIAAATQLDCIAVGGELLRPNWSVKENYYVGIVTGSHQHGDGMTTLCATTRARGFDQSHRSGQSPIVEYPGINWSSIFFFDQIGVNL